MLFRSVKSSKNILSRAPMIFTQRNVLNAIIKKLNSLYIYKYVCVFFLN